MDRFFDKRTFNEIKYKIDYKNILANKNLTVNTWISVDDSKWPFIEYHNEEWFYRYKKFIAKPPESVENGTYIIKSVPIN